MQDGWWGGVDDHEIGVMSGKLDIVITKIDRLEEKMETRYMPREESEARFQSVHERLSALEGAPDKSQNRASMWISTIAFLVSAGTAIANLFKH